MGEEGILAAWDIKSVTKIPCCANGFYLRRMGVARELEMGTR